MNNRLLTGIIAFILLGIQTTFAQVKTEKGNVDLYVKTGIGYMQTSKFNQQDYNNADQNYKGATPFIAVGMETCRWKHLAMGLLIGYSKFHSDEKIPSSPTEHYIGDITAYNVFMTLKYHLPLTFSKVATYIHADAIGLTAYQERRSVKPNGVLDDPSIGMKENYGIYAGGKYLLTKKLSAFAEVGLGYTLLNFGISTRLK